MNVKIKIGLSLAMCFLMHGAYSQIKVDNSNYKSGSAESSRSNYIESQLPAGKKWKMVWNDEFDGVTLDTTKWGYRLYYWQTRHETLTKDGASLDGKGNLLLKVYEKDGKFYSSTLQTGSMYLDQPGVRKGKNTEAWPIGKLETPKFAHRFGYYEIRCKLPTKSEGWWPAFWIQSPCIGSTLDPGISGVEIDIMENFKRDEQTRSAVLWNGYGPYGKGGCSCDNPRPGISEGYHTFGLDWSGGDYIFYIDGKEHWRFNGPVSGIEEFILVSTECAGYREGAPSPLLKKENLPDYFIVDYVRVFDEVNVDGTKK